MPLDVLNLQNFYASPLGEVSRRLVSRVIRARWETAAGLAVAALGYGSPYIERFRDTAERCIALMPAEQGVLIWPDERACASALVETQMLPLPDGSIDRLLLAHALETASQPEALLEEVWRIVAPEGRVLIVAPSRRGIWARTDATPYRARAALLKDAVARSPATRPVVADLLGRGALFASDRPTVRHPLGPRGRTARRGDGPALRRRSHRRGDQAGLPAGRGALGAPAEARAAAPGAGPCRPTPDPRRPFAWRSSFCSWRRREPVV